MKDNGKISKAVIKRLPRYRRYLEELMKKDIDRISSNDLSKLIGYTASQIRQDLNNFGGFGQQGYGYNIKGLYTQIGNILGLDQEYKMIIVGCGNLGQALANYTHYYKAGFIVCGMFDINPRLIGLRINDIEVMDSNTLEAYLEENQIDIGIICTNKDSAQEIANKLVLGRVKGIWNFAPMDLDVGDNIALENVHLSDSLHSLAYHINHME
ncbi:redox-sensing transcriptional repressor Rex [Anaerovorax sp. IOR16]|uniref:redox-sensing transcriptional repressor Rex n=1 Tax=Anaerovorax sp. IOR16 TaxID=2773458 RepID=UPI0019D15782|nr:redox-sensing transcriptional repressor Rex [Anaerovorax sp. IOR16]MEA4989023.1 redox-sensing transcriptional repressor Rex [Anaerovorax sp.]